MSDGANPAPDITLDNGEELSSPLDLDGDGIDDIQYAATKDNIKNIFVELSQILTDKDQLIAFVVGHGGIDTESYICLWNSNNNLYPSEMADYIKDINAGYITLVFGQCYSGGFEKSLKAENRLVISACRENEKSWTRPDIAYDEFVSMFTSALANVDIFDETVDADYNNDGTVTLLEAYRYAEENDGYNDGYLSFGNVREHPQESYLHGSNIEDLSVFHIPNPVELNFSDNSLPQTRVSWDTEAIILGQGTSIIDWINANSNFSENSSKFASVKIRNCGVKPYESADMVVGLDWSIASYNFDIINRSADICVGGVFGEKILQEKILPCQEKTITFEKNFSGDEIETIKAGSLGLNYRAYVYDSQGGKANVKEVLKQVQMLSYGNERKVQLVNTGSNAKSYTIGFSVISPQGEDISESAELLFCSSEISLGKRTLYGLKENPADVCSLLIEVDDAEITGVMMQPGEKAVTGLNCSFFADKAVEDTTEYIVDVAVIDEESGEQVGAERFIARRLPRKAISVNPERYIYNGNHYLTLSDKSEQVYCQWFTPNGHYIGDGLTCALGEGAVGGEYKLRAQSVEDGVVVYKTFSVVGDDLQKNVTVDKSSSRITITFRNPLQDDVDVIVSTASVKGQTMHLTKGQRVYNVPYNNIGVFDGMVMVTFIVNGVKTETYKLQ